MSRISLNPYIAFIISFLLLLALISIAAYVRSTFLEELPGVVRAISYLAFVCFIVCVWSYITYKIFRTVERRGLKTSQIYSIHEDKEGEERKSHT